MSTVPWTSSTSNSVDRSVVAYEPLRRALTQRTRPNGLRVCKAKLTLSFSVYIVTGGTLLTVSTFMLSGLLFIIGILALGFSAFMAATWLVFNKTLGLVRLGGPQQVPTTPIEARNGQHIRQLNNRPNFIR